VPFFASQATADQARKAYGTFCWKIGLENARKSDKWDTKSA
jgi:hypothetical protein